MSRPPRIQLDKSVLGQVLLHTHGHNDALQKHVRGTTQTDDDGTCSAHRSLSLLHASLCTMQDMWLARERELQLEAQRQGVPQSSAPAATPAADTAAAASGSAMDEYRALMSSAPVTIDWAEERRRSEAARVAAKEQAAVKDRWLRHDEAAVAANAIAVASSSTAPSTRVSSKSAKPESDDSSGEDHRKSKKHKKRKRDSKTLKSGRSSRSEKKERMSSNRSEKKSTKDKKKHRSRKRSRSRSRSRSDSSSSDSSSDDSSSDTSRSSSPKRKHKRSHRSRSPKRSRK